MQWYWKRREAGEFDHEAVCGAFAAGGLALARVLPLDRIPFEVCWLHRLTGWPCPSCGLTRCFVALAHGRWAEGLAFNPLAALAFFLLVLYALYAGLVVIFRKPRLRFRFSGKRERVAWLTLLIVLVVINWVYLVLAGI